MLFGPRSTFCAVGKSSALRTHLKFEIRSLTIRIYKPLGLRWIADRNTVPDSDQTADLDPWDLMPMHPRSDRRRRAGQDLSRLGEGNQAVWYGRPLDGARLRRCPDGSPFPPEALEAA